MSPYRQGTQPLRPDYYGASELTWNIHLAGKASSQIGFAIAGMPLARVEDASGYADFTTTASNNTAAWYKVAFWLAVASRIAKNRMLALSAQYARTRGATAIPYLSGDVAGIFADGAKKLQSAARGNSTVLAIAARLAGFANPQAILARKVDRAAASPNKIDDLILAPERLADASRHWPWIMGGTVALGIVGLLVYRRVR